MNKLILYISNSKFIRIIVFVVVFILATTYIFSSSIKSNSDTKLDRNLEYLDKNKDEKFDIFFFGNSYIYTAFDPLLLKSITGNNSIHFGTPSRRFCFEPYIINEVLKIRKPKLVVVDISTTSMKTPRREKDIYYNELAISSFELSFSKLKQIYLFEGKDRNDVFLKTNSQFTNILYQLTGENKFSNKHKAKNGKILGFEPLTKQHPNFIKTRHEYDSLYANPLNHKSSLSKSIDSLTLKELNRLIDYFKRDTSIELLFISSIKVNSIDENDFFIDLIKSKIHGIKNINVLEMNLHSNKKILNMKFDDFYNSSHLMLTGAYKATNFLSSYIKQNYPSLNVENSNGNFIFTNKHTDGKILVRNVQVLLEKGFDQDIRVVIDSIDKSFLDYNTVMTIVPKPRYISMLSKYSKKRGYLVDKEYLYIKDYSKVENYLIGRFNIKSKLKKEQIDHIELSFWNGKTKQGTNKVTIEI
jgi:hypothetical protein